MKLSIELNNIDGRSLKKAAKELGVSDEDLARAILSDAFRQPRDDFLNTVNYVLDKNKELYKRLS